MKQTEAQAIARQLMEKHDLNNWIFKFDGAKRRFGQCSHHRKTISLSRHLVEMNDEAEVTNTILHEIAHALVGPNHGHDLAWKREARKIGAKPVRCYSTDTVATPTGVWRARCESCGWQTERLRHRRVTKACCPMCVELYDQYDRLTWFRVSVTV